GRAMTDHPQWSGKHDPRKRAAILALLNTPDATGLSDRQIARRFGVGNQFVSRLRSGLCDSPPLAPTRVDPNHTALGRPRGVPDAIPQASSPAMPGRRLKLESGVVPDAKWPGMYRLILPDGTLSDMVNLTRANDAARRRRGP